MQHKEFQNELAPILQALPPPQREQILQLSTKLESAPRQQFYEKILESHSLQSKSEQEQQEALGKMQELVSAAERAVKGEERKQQEEAEGTATNNELSKIDTAITNFPTSSPSR